jgi:hypothetical protein
VEIKPTLELLEDDRQKIARFVRETGKNVLLFVGDPGTTAGVRFIRRVGARKLDAEDVAIIELADGQVGLISDRALGELRSNEDRALIRQRMQTDLLVRAYRAAREARFDGGGRLKRCARCGQKFRPKRNYYTLCYSCYNRKKRSTAAVG